MRGASSFAGNVLVYRIGQLGDTLVAMPAIQAIRTRYSRHKLTLLTDRHPATTGFVSSWDVLGSIGWFDDVIYYEPGQTIWEMIRNALRVAEALRLRKLERVVNLAPERTRTADLRDKFFFRILAGVRHYDGERRRPTNVGQSMKGPPSPAKPEWRRLLDIVDPEAGAQTINIQIPPAARQSVAKLLAPFGDGSSPQMIAIGPGSKMPSKQWPEDRYLEVGALLLARFPRLHLILVGGREDHAIAARLSRAWGDRSHNCAGQLSIWESAAVIERCQLYFGNDSGAMHLAAFLGVPCVAIFSARETPGRWDPIGPKHVVLRRNIDCAGCMLVVCNRNNECTRRIEVPEAFASVSALLHDRLAQV